MKLPIAALIAGICVSAASAAAPAMKHTSAGTTVAKASLLTLKDLGKGWTASGAGLTSLQFSCNGYQPNAKGLVEIGSASSSNFTGGTGGPFIAQVTSVLRGAQQANVLWTRAVKPGLITCVAQSLETITSRGIKVKILSQGALPIANVAQKTAGYRVGATLSSSKQKIKTYFDVVLVQSGQTITEVTFSSLVSPVPKNFEHAVALIVARRLGGPAA